jgi:hypothetical protein
MHENKVNILGRRLIRGVKFAEKNVILSVDHFRNEK